MAKCNSKFKKTKNKQKKPPQCISKEKPPQPPPLACPTTIPNPPIYTIDINGTFNGTPVHAIRSAAATLVAPGFWTFIETITVNWPPTANMSVFNANILYDSSLCSWRVVWLWDTADTHWTARADNNYPATGTIPLTNGPFDLRPTITDNISFTGTISLAAN